MEYRVGGYTRVPPPPVQPTTHWPTHYKPKPYDVYTAHETILAHALQASLPESVSVINLASYIDSTGDSKIWIATVQVNGKVADIREITPTDATFPFEKLTAKALLLAP